MTNHTDHLRAQQTVNLVAQFQALLDSGLSLRRAAYTLGRSPSYFSGQNSVVNRLAKGGLAALRKSVV